MELNRFDVCLAELEWRDCRDRRPVVVLSPQWYMEERTRDAVLVSLMSSALDLFDERRHLIVREDAPEFDATGLKRTSYVAVDYITYVERGELRRKLGSLTGELPRQMVSLLGSFFRLE
jgi:mRNA-degrading endonuclease toxin of MazEF toxin-antitoxin module